MIDSAWIERNYKKNEKKPRGFKPEREPGQAKQVDLKGTLGSSFGKKRQ